MNSNVPTEPVLDGVPLREIRALDPHGTRGVLTRVVRVYLGDAPRLLQAVQQTAAAADPEALWRAAHALKTASANLGAAHLASLCRELEALGRSGQTDGAAELATEIATAFREAQRALSELISGDGREPA